MGAHVEAVSGPTLPSGGAAPIGPLPGELAPVIPGDTSILVYLSGRNAQKQIESEGKQQAQSQRDATAHRLARLEALREQLERKEDAGFWDQVADVATYVAIGASVAAAVFTGGSTLVLAGALASAALGTASLASGGTLWLDEMGVDQKTAGWIATGLTVGTACLSVGGAMQAAASGAQAASATGQAVAKAATVAETGAKTVGTVAGWQSGEAKADALQSGARADLESARGEAAKSERRERIDRMKQVAEMQERITKMALEADQARHQSSLTAANGRHAARV